VGGGVENGCLAKTCHQKNLVSLFFMSVFVFDVVPFFYLFSSSSTSLQLLHRLWCATRRHICVQ